MLLNLWNIYEALSMPQKRALILENSTTIRYARIFVRDDLRSNTVYVAPGDALHYRSPGSVVIVHNNDTIFVDGMDISEVFNEVATIIDRYNYWEHRLGRATEQPDGVDRIFELAQQYLPGSYYAYTFSGKTLGLYCEPNTTNGAEWETISVTADHSHERLNALNAIVNFTRIVPGVHLQTETSKSGHFRYTYSSMEDASETIGYLLYCWEAPQLPHGAEVLLDMLMQNIVQYCKKHASALNWVAKSATVFEELCCGGSLTPEMHTFFKGIGWKTMDNYQILAVCCGENERNYRLTSFIPKTRSIFVHPIFCFHDENYLMILLNLNCEPEHKDKIKQLTEKMDRDFFCGVSAPFGSLSIIGYYSKQAIMEVQRATFSECQTSYAVEHGFQFFCDTFGSDIFSASYVSRELTALANYDLANTTEYYATMRAYILTCFHIGDAAKLANVHRNTFQYRLSQISGIIDMTKFDRMAQNPSPNELLFYQLSIFLIDCGLRRRHDRMKKSLML